MITALRMRQYTPGEISAFTKTLIVKNKKPADGVFPKITIVSNHFKTNGADFIFGNTYYIDNNGQIIDERRNTSLWKTGYMFRGMDISQPSSFWTRKIYDEAGGIDEHFSFAMDTDLFFRF